MNRIGGLLFNEYHNKQYNTNTLETEIQELLMDDDVTKNAGIIHYVLSDKTKHDEKYLSIRAFTDAQKRRAYEKQNHKCPFCMKNGVDTQYDFEDMQGDHIILSLGVRVVEPLTIIYRCSVRSVTMIRVISKE